MTRLFNKGGDGAGEIVRVLGLIDNDLDFTKWEPILPLGIRDLQAIIGTEPIDLVKGHSHFGRTTRNGRTWKTSWRE